ncbi:MAG TPA: transglycosylase domain-containing protein, partial [Gaiellales bacterium]|nr:transglycosylase domain-containing protein [Gaiellales bacterium]
MTGPPNGLNGPDQRKAYDDVLAHVSQRRRKRRAVQRRHGRRSLLATMAVVVMIGLGVLVAAGAVGGAVFVDDTLAGINFEQLTAEPPGANTRIYDREGKLLAVLPSTENRTPISYDQMSQKLKDATVAIEDKRFWDHNGVDLQGVIRAALDNLQAGQITQGASTIEQQLVRNLYPSTVTTDKTFTRKIREAYLAMQMSKEWSKQRILAEYLNVVPYGAITYGCEAAAQQYFSVHCGQLKLYQAATLAGIPKDPLLYNPIENRRASRERRNEVLDAMLQEGMITQAQHDHAVKHSIGVRPGGYLDVNNQGYFVSWVRSLLQQDPTIGRKGLKSGLEVRTTIDSSLQRAAKRAITHGLSAAYDPAPAAALVAIDPRTGEVLAMESSTSYSQSKYNLAVQGTRQAGSTFKTYALTAAINDLGIDPYSTPFMSGTFHYDLVNPPVNPETDIWNVETHAPANGPMDLDQATVNSDNTVFARLAVDLGYDRIQNMAYRLGISRKPPLPDAYSIVLGTGDVSVLDMTHAYTTLAAQGVRRDPAAMLDVKSIATGDELYHWRRPAGRRVIKDGAAYEVSKILEHNAQYGTGAASQLYLAGRTVAGKTGTTTNNWDAWFCGYSTTLSACVWVGYPKASIPMGSDIWGGSIPVNIWAQFISAAFAKEPHKFPEQAWPLPRNPVQYQPFHSQFKIVQPPPACTKPKGCGKGGGKPDGGGKSDGGGSTGGGGGGGGAA